MDPMQQIEVRDLMTIKAKTNPKPKNGRVHFHALLPLFVTILFFSYFCSVSISSAELANLLASKKALFLFSNFILVLLVIDFTLSDSGPSNSSTNTLHNDNSASLEGHLPSDSDAIVVVGDAHAAEEQLHDDSLWISSFLRVKELISLEQKGTISVDSSFAEEKKSAKEESITNIDFFGDFLTGMIGDDIEWRPEYSNKSQQGRRMITAEGGPFSTLEVVVMDDSTIGEGRTKLEAFGVADELERLELDELNRKFDQFIQREKNKRRSEALQLVIAV